MTSVLLLLDSTTTWTGSLPTWLLLAMAVTVAWRVTKGGGGSAVSELSKANEVLEKRLHEIGAEVRDLRIEKARLEARTDFEGALTRALGPLAEAMGIHEAGARDRTERLLSLLNERLPADPVWKARTDQGTVAITGEGGGPVQVETNGP